MSYFFISIMIIILAAAFANMLASLKKYGDSRDSKGRVTYKPTDEKRMIPWWVYLSLPLAFYLLYKSNLPHADKSLILSVLCLTPTLDQSISRVLGKSRDQSD